VREEEKGAVALQLDMQAAMGAFGLIKPLPPAYVECAAETSVFISVDD
jgi:hypothetical protein